VFYQGLIFVTALLPLIQTATMATTVTIFSFILPHFFYATMGALSSRIIQGSAHLMTITPNLTSNLTSNRGIVQGLVILYPPMAFGTIWGILGTYQLNGGHGELWEVSWPREEMLSLSEVVGLLLFDLVFYAVLALYLDQVATLPHHQSSAPNLNPRP